MKFTFPLLSFLFWAVVFALVHTQAPLYYSNQNQYFLHGLATGGLGQLHEDWLANTKDPTPLFSQLVAWTYRYLDERCYYLYYVLLFGVYLHSLLGVGTLHVGERMTPLLRLWFITLLLLLHSAVLRYASGYCFQVDYPWYLQAGVAGQYVLGPTLQPSVFGVLLLLSIYRFAADRPKGAVITACLGATLHTTYLLSAALLILGYLVVWWREGRYREAVGHGILALLLVAPIVGYNVVTFAPSSPEEFAAAQHILARFRIPHHCVVTDWLDVVAVVQILWVLAALVLVRRQRLFVVLLLAVLGGLGLSILQVLTESDTLALLFPWRISVLLVPLATTIWLARLLKASAAWLHPPTAAAQRMVLAGLAGMVLLLLAGGIAISWTGRAYAVDADESGLFEYVREHQEPGQIYLLPLELPRTRPRRGSFMNDFVPPTTGRSHRLIPMHLQRFRLHTGTPIYVDFKSIPYQDREVLEWHRRLQEVQEIYRLLAVNDIHAVRALLVRQNTTHVVLLQPVDILDDAFTKVYEDDRYVVCTIQRQGWQSRSANGGN